MKTEEKSIKKALSRPVLILSGDIPTLRGCCPFEAVPLESDDVHPSLSSGKAGGVILITFGAN